MAIPENQSKEKVDLVKSMVKIRGEKKWGRGREESLYRLSAICARNTKAE
jgi:predicted transcriptional regulator